MLGNPFANSLLRLEYVLTGIKRVEAWAGPPTRMQLPITIDILQKLKSAWLTPPPVPDNIMLWEAVCFGFFGFLRAGEFTIPAVGAYDPAVHLSLSDLELDSHDKPTLVYLRLKQSKTDPFRKGVNIFLGNTGVAICPVQATM